ncbi:MAG: LacI family DNA-binding transcriptional regulator [Lachnospiraceae bacterium]|nr:LacI family DNA-binding transcriptional regulator [Lachnospiraceae bacterium]
MEEITIKDIAKICGVGISTVSRAINNHPDINPETKEMIMRVIQENNYIPNNSARNLKRQDAKAIAVLVKGIDNSFFSAMIRVLEQEIKEKKYTMVLRHVDFAEDEVDVALKLVKEKRLRGIIFLGGYLLHSEEKLAQLHVPFILCTIGTGPVGYSRNTYSSVAVDDARESYKMVDYLCKSGHRDIAIICACETDASIGMLRLQGYKKALQDNGIPVKEELILPMKPDLEDYSLENGYEVTKEFLAKGTPCTAIYAISDILAIGAGKALSDAGYRVPEDISLAGFDGVEIGKYVIPALTTIKQPVDSMARETARILFEIISGREQHQHRIFEGELTIRESTRNL